MTLSVATLALDGEMHKGYKLFIFFLSSFVRDFLWLFIAILELLSIIVASPFSEKK